MKKSSEDRVRSRYACLLLKSTLGLDFLNSARIWREESQYRSGKNAIYCFQRMRETKDTRRGGLSGAGSSGGNESGSNTPESCFMTQEIASQ
jgi:hypothetical protein